MTKSEWIKIVALIASNWPSHPPPEEAIEKWYSDLSDQDAQRVYVAVETLYRDGRKFPPNGGQIIAKLAELDRDDPDHGEAWRLVYDALAKHVPNWQAFYASLPPAVSEAARRMTFESQGGFLKADEPTIRAQFREAYKAVCAGRQRDGAYAGLPDGGLPGLQRGPRTIGPVLARIAAGGAGNEQGGSG